MSDPNVLFVILDSVRAKNCSLHGHKNETTPFLEDFAKESVNFKHARSPSIHSISSHASMFTGLDVEEHQVTNHGSNLNSNSTIWMRLSKNKGYSTALFTPNVVITESSNLGDSFDFVSGPKRTTNKSLFESGLSPDKLDYSPTYSEYLNECLNSNAPIRSAINGISNLVQSSVSHDPSTEHGSIYVNELMEWIDSTESQWAACLNLMDAHYPYVPSSDHDLWAGPELKSISQGLQDGPLVQKFPAKKPWGQLESLEPLYDGCIHEVDSIVESLISDLKDRHLLEDTLVIITSDHGEGFGEQSHLNTDVRLIDHNWGIHEALTHVPLVVNDTAHDQHRVVDDVVSLTNLPELIWNEVTNGEGIESFVSSRDEVLSSTVRVEPPGELFEMEGRVLDAHYGPWRALYKNTENGVKKFATRGDPVQDHIIMNIADAQKQIITDEKNPKKVTSIFENLSRSDVSEDSYEDDIDGSTKSRLEDLGYI